jgi:hypothetical protein
MNESKRTRGAVNVGGERVGISGKRMSGGN